MKIILLLLLSFLLISCKSFEDAGKVLRNEKKTSTDEFLVKKREPLILPPDYNDIPVPGEPQQEIKEKDRIKKIINTSEKKSKNNDSSSLEKSILEKIAK